MQILRNIDKKSFLSFRIGIFLLVSTPFLSSIFFLLSLINSLINNSRKIINNKWNYPIFIASLLLINSSIFSRSDIEGWSPYLNWLGLGNWIPYFLCFFAFQYYTDSKYQRKKIIRSFIAGSVPFIISGFGQYFFNWTGPFDIFNKLIIWYQRPIVQDHGLTGLFNNPNYAATWLLILWPMCLASLKEKKHNKFKKTITLTFIILIFISIILTRSRNGWLGSIISIPLLGSIYLKIFSILFLSLAILVFILFISSINLNSLFNRIIPRFFKEEFLLFGFDNILNLTRVKIWLQTIIFILEKPIFGWGAGTFAILIESKMNSWYGHPHNIWLELAHSYGIPVSILLLITIIYILFKSFKVIYLKPETKELNLFDRAWWTTTFTLTFSQMVDIQYFDYRIGITFWILYSGLVSIINSKNKEYHIP